MLFAPYRLNVRMWLQFLAFRLSEVKLNCEHLTADLNMTMVTRLLCSLTSHIFCVNSSVATIC